MKLDKPRIGLVGYGYWGPNLLRNLVANPGCEVVGVVEIDEAAREKAARLYPQIPTFRDLNDFLKRVAPNAMVVATPPATHCAVASECLKKGCHVLIEKPFALSVSECDQILGLAEQAKLQVMVDHTFAYHPAVQYLVDQKQKGDLGDLLYYDSVRANLGGFQARTNVLWDLAPHDLSILDLLTGGVAPLTVSAVGVKHFDSPVEDIAYVHLTYPNHFVAHLHLNWIAPVKIRTITIGGSKKMAVFDENIPAERVKIYDKGISLALSPTQEDFKISYRLGDMVAPAISHREPLDTMVCQFLKHVTSGEKSVSDGNSGRRVVQILEASARSLAENGQPVELHNLASQPARRLRRAA